MSRVVNVTGDVLESSVPPRTIKIIPHVVNDIGAWGAGFVVALSNKWKEPEEAYRSWHANGGCYQRGSNVPFALGKVQFVRVADGNTVVANMVGQHQVSGMGSGKPIRYTAIMQAMQEVAAFALKLKEKGHGVEIHAPKFGAGLAGGNWKLIEELINEIWVANSIKVTIFTL